TSAEPLPAGPTRGPEPPPRARRPPSCLRPFVRDGKGGLRRPHRPTGPSAPIRVSKRKRGARSRHRRRRLRGRRFLVCGLLLRRLLGRLLGRLFCLFRRLFGRLLLRRLFLGHFAVSLLLLLRGRLLLRRLFLGRLLRRLFLGRHDPGPP